VLRANVHRVGPVAPKLSFIRVTMETWKRYQFLKNLSGGAFEKNQICALLKFKQETGSHEHA